MIIKKYTNRKLYNPETTKYITLDQLIMLMKNGQKVQVIDHLSGLDITNETLKACVARLNLDNEVLGQLVMAG
jgi:polyhydroxyalkanoate synthesis repressor PhaR